MDRRLLVRGLLIVSMAGLLSGYSLAADQPGQTTRDRPAQTGQTQQQQRQTGLEATGQTMALVRANELIGNDVRNEQGQNLGNVHDIVLTPDLQQVSYVALARGGIWGIGADLFAIPWQAVRVGPDDTLTARISEQQLKAADGFDSNNWPAQGDQRWATGMRTGQTFDRQTPMGQERDTTGQTTTPGVGDRTAQRQTRPGQTTEREPAAGQTRPQQDASDRTAADRGTRTMRGDTGRQAMTAESRDVQQRRVTNLTGTDVKNPEGEDIANIEDLVIDAQEGRVAYTIVSFGGFWGIGERYAAVPHSIIQIQPRRNVATLDADRETLEAIAFESREFPDLANREYAQQLHQRFNAEPYWVIYGYVPPEQQQAASQKAWGTEGEYAKQFDAENVRTIKGTVQSVGSFRPGEAPGISQGLRLRVTTEDQQNITVHAGPQQYAQQQNFFVRPGEEVTITGSETKIGWRSVFMASEIRKGDQTLRLRDKTGQPQWQISGEQRPGQMGQQPGQPGQTQPGQPGQTQPGQPGQTQPGQTGQRPGQTTP